MRFLIVNADDFNLTPGVNRAILECHDRGILSSTTFMANLPVDARAVRELKKRKKLGVGIHLNVTLKTPLSRPEKVRSLMGAEGRFRKYPEQTSKLPKADELALEYATQIEFFKKIFGRMPTHLDTHHQVHNFPFFLRVLCRVARYYKLPVRRSTLMRQPGIMKECGVRTPDHFFGNLSPQGFWTAEPLESLLRNLPAGVSEIMCHPGIVDTDLKSVSSFTTGRAVEHALFSSSRFRRLLADMPVRLGHYGLCYT